jgi:hypothetical protein
MVGGDILLTSFAVKRGSELDNYLGKEIGMPPNSNMRAGGMFANSAC